MKTRNAITTLALPVVLTCATLVAGPAAAETCTPAHKFDTIQKGVMTVAATTFPPFSIPQTDGSITGIDAEIVNSIAAMECLTVKAVPVEYAAAIQYVVAGKADVAIGDYYRTEIRQQVVNMSSPLYVDEMGILSKDGLDTIDSLKGKNVGTVQGYLWVADMKAVLGNDLKLYNTNVAMQQDLRAGRIQVGVDGTAASVEAQKKGALEGIQIKVAKPDPRVRASVEAAQAGLPLSKTNDAMLIAVNEDLAEIRKSGKLVEIMEKFGMPASAAETGAPRLIK